MVVKDKRAYVCTRELLTIFDLTDVNSPREMGSCKLKGTLAKLAVQDDFACVQSLIFKRWPVGSEVAARGGYVIGEDSEGRQPTRLRRYVWPGLGAGVGAGTAAILDIVADISGGEPVQRVATVAGGAAAGDMTLTVGRDIVRTARERITKGLLKESFIDAWNATWRSPSDRR